MATFYLSTETGKFARDTDRDEFLKILKKLKDAGESHVTMTVTGKSVRILRFFMVIVHYVTAQNCETINYTRDDFNFTKEWIVSQYMPKKICFGDVRSRDGKTRAQITMRKSLGSARQYELRELIENALAGLTAQGYVVPDPVRFNEIRDSCGTEIAIQQCREDIKTKIESLYGRTNVHAQRAPASMRKEV